MSQACLEVTELAMKGTMLGEREPTMALRINLSCLIQERLAVLGMVLFSVVVIVDEGQGFDPLM